MILNVTRRGASRRSFGLWRRGIIVGILGIVAGATGCRSEETPADRQGDGDPALTAPAPAGAQGESAAAAEDRAAGAATDGADVKAGGVAEGPAAADGAAAAGVEGGAPTGTTPAELAVGRPAPDFTLNDQDGRAVRLADLRGKWVVLYFYPKDDTPGCTIEAQEFTEQHEAFAELNAVVFGVSADGVQSHCDFRDKYGLKVTLLADPEGTVSRAYDSWNEGPGFAKRTTVLIDPAGRVVHRWPTVDVRGHAAEVRGKIEELRAASRVGRAGDA